MKIDSDLLLCFYFLTTRRMRKIKHIDWKEWMYWWFAYDILVCTKRIELERKFKIDKYFRKH